MSSQSAEPPSQAMDDPEQHAGGAPWRVWHWGREVPYGTALARQAKLHAQVAAADCDDHLCLLEHTRVITCGRNTQPGHVLADEAALREAGIELYETGRGGDVTYHGPGQLVGYPIVRLRPYEQDVRKYVYNLEEALILTARHFGVLAQRIDGLRGIWVGNEKLAAIGVRLARWTTSHGFALNVSTDLCDFDYIVPCGLRGRGVTSLAQLLGHAPPMGQVEEVVQHHLSACLGRREKLNSQGR